MLLASAAVTALLGHPVDTVVILAVVLADAVIGYVQEGRAEEAMAAIRTLLSPVASVLRTIAVNTIVVMEVFHLFFVRNIYGTSLSFRAVAGTPAVWAAVVAVAIGQFAITYVPFLQGVFGTAGVSLVDGLAIVGVGIALFAILEVEKQIRLHLTGPVRSAAS